MPRRPRLHTANYPHHITNEDNLLEPARVQQGVRLAWFPRLLNATAEQRQAFELSHQGIHWDELDEDISMDGLLAGFGDLSQSRYKAA